MKILFFSCLNGFEHVEGQIHQAGKEYPVTGRFH